MKTFKKILFALFATTMVIGFTSCSDDDDGSSVKGMYSFKELDTMRKMSADNLIKKLTRDGYTYSSYEDIDEDDVYVAYEFRKDARNKEYYVECSPTLNGIDFRVSESSNQLDQKILTSILDDEKKFAGNNTLKKITVSLYDEPEKFYDKEAAKEAFLSYNGFISRMTCYYDGFYTVIKYYKDGGEVMYGYSIYKN